MCDAFFLFFFISFLIVIKLVGIPKLWKDVSTVFVLMKKYIHRKQMTTPFLIGVIFIMVFMIIALVTAIIVVFVMGLGKSSSLPDFKLSQLQNECTLTTYAFKHHFVKLLTGPRKEFAIKILDSIHEVQSKVQTKYMIPLLEDTLDMNLQLIFEGIDWLFLSNIVDNVKGCLLTFLDNTNSMRNNFTNMELCMRNLRLSIDKERAYHMYMIIHKNLRKNYDEIKFVKYEKAKRLLREYVSKQQYLDQMNDLRKNIKAFAEKPFIPKSNFYGYGYMET